MFNVQFLHVVREFELARIASYLPPGARVLEIGGGSGYQALRLGQLGFEVCAVDVAGSTYAADMVFPVQIYDGKHLPFPDESFDVVFSSNVLEHIREPGEVHREACRVLRPGGYCVHVVPTGAWRFWTNVTHYVEMMQRIGLALPDLLPRGISRGELIRLLRSVSPLVRIMERYLIVPRHGEHGNALSEIFSFSARRWRRELQGQGFDILEVAPMGLFYTGNMVLGERLSLRYRQRIARVLGSACVLYRLSPHRPFGIRSTASINVPLAR